MLCSKCGADNPAEARFCGKCGAGMSAPPVMPAHSTADKRAQGNPDSNKSRLNIPVMLVIVVILIAGIGGLLAVKLFISSRAKTPDPEIVVSPNQFPETTPTMPPIGVPPTPSKFEAHNDTMNVANTARPAKPAPNSDAVYQNKVLGVWRARTLVLGAQVDLRCSFTPGGRASWTGSYMYLGMQYPLFYSGTWEVKDGYCRTVIESSNVPQIIPVGMTGASKFISITDDEWTFMDLSDGQTQTITRIQ